MKKIIIMVLLIMTVLSTGFLVTNIQEYSENNKKVEKKDRTQNEASSDSITQENVIKEKKSQYEKLKEEKKEELEVYEKWVEKVKEMEKNLQ